jgi:orotidine-5'-phosphate decarboxylase
MSFVLANAEHTDPRSLQLADVVIHLAQQTVRDADELARETMRRLPGCAVVAVGVAGRGCLLRYRGGRRAFICPGTGSTQETVRLATLGYAMVIVAP